MSCRCRKTSPQLGEASPRGALSTHSVTSSDFIHQGCHSISFIHRNAVVGQDESTQHPEQDCEHLTGGWERAQGTGTGETTTQTTEMTTQALSPHHKSIQAIPSSPSRTLDLGFTPLAQPHHSGGHRTLWLCPAHPHGQL